MNTLSKLVFAPAIAMASLALPASAGDDQDIVVTSPGKMSEWQADMGAQLDRNMVLAEGIRREGPMSALVQIRFTLDEEGRPTNLKTVHHSGSHSARRAARAAVRNLRGLDEAPVANVANATFQANLIFARDLDDKARLEDEMGSANRARLASGEVGSVIQLGG